jgi:hypothetical protein
MGVNGQHGQGLGHVAEATVRGHSDTEQ